MNEAYIVRVPYTIPVLMMEHYVFETIDQVKKFCDDLSFTAIYRIEMNDEGNITGAYFIGNRWGNKYFWVN